MGSASYQLQTNTVSAAFLQGNYKLNLVAKSIESFTEWAMSLGVAGCSSNLYFKEYCISRGFIRKRITDHTSKFPGRISAEEI